MNIRKLFLASSCVGIMLLNNTATAHADWSAGGAAINNYSGELVLSSMEEHNLIDFRRVDSAGTGGDSLFGSTSIQAPVTLVAGSNIEIEIMTAGEEIIGKTVNEKVCSGGKKFNAFVTPVATCSSHYGSNFSGFRAQAENVGAQVEGSDETNKWKPMLYMNVKGRWVDLSADNTDSGLIFKDGDQPSTAEQCAQVLVQKICQ